MCVLSVFARISCLVWGLVDGVHDCAWGYWEVWGCFDDVECDRFGFDACVDYVGECERGDFAAVVAGVGGALACFEYYYVLDCDAFYCCANLALGEWVKLCEAGWSYCYWAIVYWWFVFEIVGCECGVACCFDCFF